MLSDNPDADSDVVPWCGQAFNQNQFINLLYFLELVLKV